MFVYSLWVVFDLVCLVFASKFGLSFARSDELTIVGLFGSVASRLIYLGILMFWCSVLCYLLAWFWVWLAVNVVYVRWGFGEFGVRRIVRLGSFALYVFEYLIVRCNCLGWGLGVCVTLLGAV